MDAGGISASKVIATGSSARDRLLTSGDGLPYQLSKWETMHRLSAEVDCWKCSQHFQLHPDEPCPTCGRLGLDEPVRKVPNDAKKGLSDKLCLDLGDGTIFVATKQELGGINYAVVQHQATA